MVGRYLYCTFLCVNWNGTLGRLEVELGSFLASEDRKLGWVHGHGEEVTLQTTFFSHGGVRASAEVRGPH